MAFSAGHVGGSLPGVDIVKDSNPASDSLRYRSLLKDIDNGIGERDMDKLRYLCQDLGVAPRKFEGMKRGIQLFSELESLALIMPDDISLLTALMQAINRYDLVKKLKAWSSLEGKLAQRLSDYRKLMLKISESLNKDEREQLRFYLGGDSHSSLPVSVMEECKTLLQLFTQMEKYTMIGPNNLSLLVNILSEIGNQAIVKEIQHYLRQAPIMSTSSSSPSMYPSASPGYHMHPAGAGYTSTPTPGNLRCNSDPGFSKPAACPASSNPGQPQPLGQHQWQQQRGWTQPVQPMSSGGYSLLQQQQEELQQLQQQQVSTSSTGSMSSLGMQKPKWYEEAVQKSGQEYADSLWEQYLQLSQAELESRMRKLQISQSSMTPSETTPSMAAEGEAGGRGEDSEEEEMQNLPGEQIIETTEDSTTTTETRQGSTATNQSERIIVAAQTATINRYPEPSRGLSLPRYPMDKLPRGLCIIFNAKNFSSDSGLERRDGTDKDVEVLRHTFMDKLRFSIYVKDDPKSSDYIKCLEELKGMDHSQYDAFACIILSHGTKGCVYGSDGKKMSIDSLTNMFRGEYVPSLAGKPKMFFIQACQGNDSQTAVEVRQDATSTIPNESDTLVSLSTVPGYASNRSPSQGTWFIASLCRILNTYYTRVDLLSMLTMVNDLLSAAADREQMKQIAYPSHTLRKQVYFNDGL